jgi:hypothetical protein
MAANLSSSGVLLRLAPVVVHPDTSKCNELGPLIVCIRESLHILFKFEGGTGSTEQFMHRGNWCCLLCLDVTAYQNSSENQTGIVNRGTYSVRTGTARYTTRYSTVPPCTALY